MRHLKAFEDFIKEGIINKVSIDKERAKGLISESERKMRSLNESLEKIGIKDENANDYVEFCYDIVMFLVRAKLYLEGYAASGQGAHEAEVAYMRKLGVKENDVMFADQLRYFRNRILYYGNSFDKEYAEKVLEFMKNTSQKIKHEIKELE